MPRIRYENFDRATLLDYVRRLTDVCRTVEAVAQQMELQQIDVLPIYNADILELGTARVENFAPAASRSMGRYIADPDKMLADEINAQLAAEREAKKAKKKVSKRKKRPSG